MQSSQMMPSEQRQFDEQGHVMVLGRKRRGNDLNLCVRGGMADTTLSIYSRASPAVHFMSFLVVPVLA